MKCLWCSTNITGKLPTHIAKCYELDALAPINYKFIPIWINDSLSRPQLVADTLNDLSPHFENDTLGCVHSIEKTKSETLANGRLLINHIFSNVGVNLPAFEKYRIPHFGIFECIIGKYLLITATSDPDLECIAFQMNKKTIYPMNENDKFKFFHKETVEFYNYLKNHENYVLQRDGTYDVLEQQTTSKYVNQPETLARCTTEYQEKSPQVDTTPTGVYRSTRGAKKTIAGSSTTEQEDANIQYYIETLETKRAVKRNFDGIDEPSKRVCTTEQNVSTQQYQENAGTQFDTPATTRTVNSFNELSTTEQEDANIQYYIETLETKRAVKRNFDGIDEPSKRVCTTEQNVSTQQYQEDAETPTPFRYQLGMSFEGATSTTKETWDQYVYRQNEHQIGTPQNSTMCMYQSEKTFNVEESAQIGYRVQQTTAELPLLYKYISLIPKAAWVHFAMSYEMRKFSHMPDDKRQLTQVKIFTLLNEIFDGVVIKLHSVRFQSIVSYVVDILVHMGIDIHRAIHKHKHLLSSVPFIPGLLDKYVKKYLV
jgi:hypothetical protein